MQKQKWTIFLPEEVPLTEQAQYIIRDDEHHYLSRVLRLHANDTVHVTNSAGFFGKAKIIAIEKNQTTLLLESCSVTLRKKPEIHLILGQPKPSTLEDIISYSSELGVDTIHIFPTNQTQIKAPLKMDKLKKIAKESLRISKSPHYPNIFSYKNMHAFNEQNKENILNTHAINLFCDETIILENKITNLFLDYLNDVDINRMKGMNTIFILVGPEASFTSEEQKYITKQMNFMPVSLGSSILKVETAVYSAVSVALQFREMVLSKLSNV